MIVAYFITYNNGIKPYKEQDPTPRGSPPLIQRRIGQFGLFPLNRIGNREGLGFEGLISASGGGKDPPMWGTVLILVPYPTTLVHTVQFHPYKKLHGSQHWTPAGWGGRENLWRRGS